MITWDDYSKQFDLQNAQQQPQTQQGGGDLISNLISGLINPIVTPIKTIAEGANILGQKGNLSNYKPQFLSQEEFANIGDRPVQNLVSQVAGIAPYLMPGIGTGIGGAIGTGAAMGSLGGLSQSLEDKNANFSSVLGGTLKGGLTGGAVGGGLGVLGKVVSRGATKIGKNLRKAGLDLETDINSIKGIATKAEREKFINSNATGSLTAKLGQLQGDAEKILGSVKEATAGTQKIYNVKDILSQITGKFKNQKSVTKYFNNEIRGDITDLGNQVTVQQLADMFADNSGRLTNYYNRVGRGIVSDSAEESARKVIRDTVSGILKKDVPGTTAAFNTLSKLHEVNKGLSQTVNKGKSLHLPFNSGLGLNVQRPLTATTDLVGRGLEKVGKGAGTLTGQTGNLQKLTSRGLYSSLGRSVNQPQQLAQQGQGLVSSLGQTQTGGLGTIPPEDNSQQRFQSMSGYINQGYTPAEAKTIVDMQYPVSKAVTTKTSKDVVNAKAGLTALNDIARLVQTNQGSLALPYFLKGGEAKQLNTAINQASDVIARLRTGAAINKEEEELYRSMLPSVFDDADTINYKLQTLAGLFNSFMQ